MISDNHGADAAQTSGLRESSVSGTTDKQPEVGVLGIRTVSCLTWAAAMRWGVCVAYVALVTWLSLAPERVFEAAPALFGQADKLVHFLMYGFFVVVVRWALTGSGVRWRPQGFWVPVAALTYGGLMELLQLWLVPADRSFEVGDMLANSIGAFVFWSGCNLWSAHRMRASAP